ncbi:MAG: 6-pyruvoyl tetrahydropterin synthase family protein [Pikeienuella sp.]
MYAVEVRDHIMIAHSLAGEVFGPAQKLHGATYVVDVAFFRETLTEHGIVVDIGRAHDALKAALARLNFSNLDEMPEFQGLLTTTEFLCRHIFDDMAQAAQSGALGPGSDGLSQIRVTLHESHVARAWFEGPVGTGGTGTGGTGTGTATDTAPPASE